MIWKLDLSDKIRQDFFQTTSDFTLLYGCTTSMLTEHIKKMLDENYSIILLAILNEYWKQHPTKQQLYSHLPPISQTLRVRRTRRTSYCWRSNDELISYFDLLLTLRRYMSDLCRQWILRRGPTRSKRWYRQMAKKLGKLSGLVDEDDIHKLYHWYSLLFNHKYYIHTHTTHTQHTHTHTHTTHTHTHTHILYIYI